MLCFELGTNLRDPYVPMQKNGCFSSGVFAMPTSLSILRHAFACTRDVSDIKRQTKNTQAFLAATGGQCAFRVGCETVPLTHDPKATLKVECSSRVFNVARVFVGSVHTLERVLDAADLYADDNYCRQANTFLETLYPKADIKKGYNYISTFANHPTAVTVDGGIHLLKAGDKVIDADLHVQYELHKILPTGEPDHSFMNAVILGPEAKGLSVRCEGWDIAPLRRAGWPHEPLMRDLSKPAPR